MRILLAYSGGLDTSWLVARLAREPGTEVTALTVDCGGFTPEQRRSMAERALALGAAGHCFVDGRARLFQRVLRWLIAGNVRRGGVYPLSVGAERTIMAEILAEAALREGFDAVAHGSTGAGNDQVRFEAAWSAVAPGLQVLAPVRDLAPSRTQQRADLEQARLPLPEAGGRYSVNAGLWGLTIGGGEMGDSAAPLPEEAWQWTRPGDASARFTLAFERGVPVGLDGERLDPVALIERLNRAAGRCGAGRGYHLGDTVLGIKGRVAFEAPAAELILSAHRELEKLVLTEEQRFWKDQLADAYGRKVHQGLLHEPLLRDIEALFASSQQRVSGVARVHAAAGRVLVEGVESPHSLLAASDARYGERPEPGRHPGGAAELARILAEPARLYARAGGTTPAALAP
ncbi:MAG: argininosuccinate synthase [Planctomycetota bacterium]|nr:MAG: argininosuccinate synthase [Planctomycetota bacterium]